MEKTQVKSSVELEKDRFGLRGVEATNYLKLNTYERTGKVIAVLSYGVYFIISGFLCDSVLFSSLV